MRTVTYSAACSLDGYIAGSDGSFDWLYFSPDVEELMGQYWSNVDAVLMGRKTWEFSAGQEFSSGAEADDTASAESPEGTDASKGAALTGDGGDAPDLSGIPPVTTYLFSRTLTESRALDGGCVLMNYRVRN